MLESARGMPALAVGAGAVIAALIVSGLLATTTRTYTLRDPNFTPVVTVTQGHAACEVPITSSGVARGVEIFGEVSRGDPRVAVEVDSLQGRVIASGLVRDPRASSQQDVRLDRPIPGGAPVRVCIRTLRGRYELKGSDAINPQIHATGAAGAAQFSLLLTRSETPLRSLSTAFGRASIFRPSWVDTWVFWLLLGLLAVTFLVAMVGIRSASAADHEARAATERTHARRDRP